MSEPYPYAVPAAEDFPLLQWAASFTAKVPPYEYGIVFTKSSKPPADGFVQGEVWINHCAWQQWIKSE